MEPRRVSKEPGGHDPTDVSRHEGDGNRSRAAVMRLYVIRKPRGEAGSAAITAYDLQIQCAVVCTFLF